MERSKAVERKRYLSMLGNQVSPANLRRQSMSVIILPEVDIGTNTLRFCFVFTAFAPKCKVMRERDTKSHARCNGAALTRIESFGL